MPLIVRVLDILSGKRAVILNKADAASLGIELHDRVKVVHENKTSTALVEITEDPKLVPYGEIGFYKEIAIEMGALNGETTEISVAKIPSSVTYIRKKLKGQVLSTEEISSIVEDAVTLNLSELEIAAFLLAQQFYSMNMDEIEALTKGMLKAGRILELPGKVVDKHSIGGVPGNKVSLLIVPIIASTGLYIPKTSSRAITSPSGTTDTMSVLANVQFSIEEFKTMVMKIGGAIVWGGALNLAPADDIFIRVEQPLKIDPRSQMLASIMSKKAAEGISYLVLDLPTGKGAKVETMEQANSLAADFIELGKRLGIIVKCGITYGGQPIGRAVGPALEAIEALKALEHPDEASRSLVGKSTALAGLLLEITGLARRGEGAGVAMDIIKSGKAEKKFREIIEAQGGDPHIKPEEIQVGKYTYQFIADTDGYVTLVDNDIIKNIARAAGAPIEKGSGIVLYAKQGYKVEKGQVLMEIYAERSTKLQESIAICNNTRPIIVENMLLYTVPEY
jgi:AMP phosphorylase